MAVGPGVPLQTQLVLDVQDGFLQKPLEQTRFDAQLLLLPQVPPQALGVPEGMGVPVGVGEAVPLGVGEGDVELRVKASAEQLPGTSAARGILEGTLGATGCCLN